MMLLIASLLSLAFAKNFTLTLDCSLDACPNSYTFNGKWEDPAIQCSLGDWIIFQVNAPEHPLWVKTQRVTGSDTSIWPGVAGNGQEVGTVEFLCDALASADSPLYYQCGIHSLQGGTICIDEVCGAKICPNDVCWGAAPEGATPTQIGNYLASLEADLEYVMNDIPGVSDFTVLYNFVDGEATVSFSYTTSYTAATTLMRAALADGTGYPSKKFEFITSSTTSPVTANITISGSSTTIVGSFVLIAMLFNLLSLF